MLEGHLAPRVDGAGRLGSRVEVGSTSSSASSSSKTRSADATPDCSRLAIDAIWVSGWVNMPRVLDERLHLAEAACEPDATRRPPTTAITT